MNLTIAIPTYNRHEPLANTLRHLLPQLNSRCRLLIVDNASEPPVADTVGRLLTQGEPFGLRVARNKTNIGANANIMRCMDLCETEWLWILCDDDRIWDDAVAKIFKEIDNHPEAACLNFAQAFFPRSEAAITRGRSEFLKALKQDFSTLLFLSTSVYRMDAISPSLMHGYLQIPSFAPHLATLTMALEKNEVVYFSQDTIVEYIPAQRGSGWSPFWVEQGFPLLLDLPLASHERDLLKSVLRPRLRLKGLLAAYTSVLCYGWRAADMRVCGQLYTMIALRRASVTQSISERLLTAGLQMTLITPTLALRVIQVFYLCLTGRDLKDRALTVGLAPEDRV